MKSLRHLPDGAAGRLWRFSAPSTESRTAGAPASSRPASGDVPAGVLRRAVVYCSIWVGSVRAALVIVALLAQRLPAAKPADVPGWPAPRVDGSLEQIATALERWDALWFLRIAGDGYRLHDGSAAFWPGFPLATRALSVILGGRLLPASLILSLLFSVAALTLFYLLGTLEFGESLARRSVSYLALFPTAFFLAAPYSEAMFLCLSLGALLAVRMERYWLSALCAALASATRSIGIILLLPLVLEALATRRARSPRDAFGTALGLSAACLSGAALYLAYWAARSGNWLEPFSSQSQWLRDASWPWETISLATTLAWRYDAVWHRIDWLLMIPMLAIALWSLGWMRASYSAYVWGSLVVILSFVFPARPLMSAPRFVLALIPLFWALARLTGRASTHRIVAFGLGAGQALLAAAFMAWYPIF